MNFAKQTEADGQVAKNPAPPGLIVRARRLADLEGLTELVNLPGVRFGTMRLPFHSPEEVRGWIEKTAATDLELVGEMEGRIVASAGLFKETGRRSHAATLGMGVHDECVGRGIGTAMLAALLDAADNWLGVRRLHLTVYIDNVPAIKLYRHFGFVVEGTHRAYALRNGKYVDTHTMARLGGADPLTS